MVRLCNRNPSPHQLGKLADEEAPPQSWSPTRLSRAPRVARSSQGIPLLPTAQSEGIGSGTHKVTQVIAAEAKEACRDQTLSIPSDHRTEPRTRENFLPRTSNAGAPHLAEPSKLKTTTNRVSLDRKTRLKSWKSFPRNTKQWAPASHSCPLMFFRFFHQFSRKNQPHSMIF